MKNILKLTALLVIISFSYAKAQTAYDDAVKLKVIFSGPGLDDASFKQASDILFNYTTKVSKNSLYVQKQFADTHNPFIPPAYAAYVPSAPSLAILRPNFVIAVAFGRAPSFVTLQQSGAQGVIGSIGGIDVSAFADGVAQFLISRAKAELTEAFFDRLKTFLGNYPEVKTLFPNTCVLLDSFDSYDYSNILNTLKEAFDKDIKLLPSDLIKLKDLTNADCTSGNADCIKRIATIKTFFATDEGILLLSAFRIGDGIIKRQKMPDIINAVVQPGFLLDYKGKTPALTNDVINSLQLLNIFNLSLESGQPGINYIDGATFDNLMADNMLLQIYLGLVYQQVSSTNGGHGLVINGVNLTGAAAISIANIDNVKLYLTNLYNQVRGLQQAYDIFTQDKLFLKKDLGQDYTALFEAAQQLLQSGMAVNTITANMLNKPASDKLNNILSYTGRSLQITNDLYIRNYNAVVIGTLSLLADALKSSQSAGNKDIEAFFSYFLKYGSFAANIVSAKNGDDAEKAIEAIALPAGSYTMKQKALCNISINGYLGYARDYYGGKLYAQGLYAPVGVSASLGLGPNFGGALTLFVSAIDVGALVSYKLHNNTGTGTNTDTLKQEVRLESIISPSAQLFFEIPKLPIAVGAGWRMTPKLFYSNNTTLTPVPSRSVFNVSVLIDIPILTLHSSSYKKMAKN